MTLGWTAIFEFPKKEKRHRGAKSNGAAPNIQFQLDHFSYNKQKSNDFVTLKLCSIFLFYEGTAPQSMNLSKKILLLDYYRTGRARRGDHF